MKRALALLLLALPCAGGEIRFADNLESAEKDGRPVFLYFTFET